MLKHVCIMTVKQIGGAWGVGDTKPEALIAAQRLVGKLPVTVAFYTCDVPEGEEVKWNNELRLEAEDATRMHQRN